VIDVVDDALAVAQLDQVADRLEDVPLGEDLGLDRLVDLELVVQLDAADPRQVVALGVEEQVLEQVAAVSIVGGSPGRRRR
jgi:CHASE3 domain sensor protein